MRPPSQSPFTVPFQATVAFEAELPDESVLVVFATALPDVGEPVEIDGETYTVLGRGWRLDTDKRAMTPRVEIGRVG